MQLSNLNVQWFSCNLTDLFQATLERLEGIMQMPSQEEFVEMTSGSNGQYVNGHDTVPGSLEVFIVYLLNEIINIYFDWRH